MADFSVSFSNGKVEAYSGDVARYEIDGGSAVLTVFDGSGKRLRFSPSGWFCIEDVATGSLYEQRGLTSV